ncbi:MAG: lycopene cyclase family protein, partial [Myxococcota bacterium]
YAAWPNNYGAWSDELPDWREAAEKIWPKTEIRLDGHRVHVLDRPYMRLDNRRVQDRLRRRGEAAGLEVRQDSVEAANHTTGGSTLTVADGESIDAVLVIDATGHQPRLIRPRRGRAAGVQVAYGVQAVLEKGEIDRDRMVLMDFSADHLLPAEREPPTFLYTMPLDGHEVFVEETSLVGRPPVSIDLCRERLALRLRSRGWRLGPATEVEHCFIPMGGPQPRPQRVVPFGGAAASVHPATGYMLANVLRVGPRLAAAVHAVRDRREAAVWSRAAWSAVWPADRTRAWALYRYGMEVLVNMDVSATAGFFDTFFQLQPNHWQAYLSGDVESRQVAAAMWSLFRKAAPALRWQLMSKGFYALMPGVTP